MVRKTSYFTLALISLSLTGCAYIAQHSIIQHREQDYLTARSIPPIKVPPGLSSSMFQNSYSVSDKHYPEAVLKQSTLPPGIKEK